MGGFGAGRVLLFYGRFLRLQSIMKIASSLPWSLPEMDVHLRVSGATTRLDQGYVALLFPEVSPLEYRDRQVPMSLWLPLFAQCDREAT